MSREKQVELKPCPFCGGKAEIKKGKAYYIDAIYAHCTKCGATMPKVPMNHLFYTQGKEVRFTEEQAMQKTANEWNRRADYRKQNEGEWIWKSNGYKNRLHCSICNKPNEADISTNFCPNCGAKMKGGAE